MLLNRSLYVLNWDNLLSILDFKPVLIILLHTWYVSASSMSWCHAVASFSLDFTNVFALARYSPTVSSLFMESLEIFTLASIPLWVDPLLLVSFLLIADHSTSPSSCSMWCMISCTFPLTCIITKSVLHILYMVEYDSIVLRNWFSSPGFPSNVGMLLSTSFGMSALYHVIMVLGTVAISDMLGFYSVICGSFVYVDVPVVL